MHLLYPYEPVKESYQQRYINGFWGPLMIDGKEVPYEGYPLVPAPQTIAKMKAATEYDEKYRSTNKEIDTRPYKVYETEDCMGNRYFQRTFADGSDAGSGYQTWATPKGN